MSHHQRVAPRGRGQAFRQSASPEVQSASPEVQSASPEVQSASPEVLN